MHMSQQLQQSDDNVKTHVESVLYKMFTSKIKSLDTSIDTCISKALVSQIDTSVATIIDTKLTAHLVTIDNRLDARLEEFSATMTASLTAEVNKFCSQSRTDVPGTEDSLLGNERSAEDSVLGTGAAVSSLRATGGSNPVHSQSMQDPSPPDSQDMHDQSKAQHSGYQLFRPDTARPHLHYGDVRQHQGASLHGSNGRGGASLGRGRGCGTQFQRVNPYAGNRMSSSTIRNTNAGLSPNVRLSQPTYLCHVRNIRRWWWRRRQR